MKTYSLEMDRGKRELAVDIGGKICFDISDFSYFDKYETQLFSG